MTHTITTQIVHHGYLAVLLLMVLESACIPVPSEVIMLLGGALAGGLVIDGVHPHLNVVVVALMGALGNVIGSAIAYEVGRWGGRPLVDRYGKYILIRSHDMDRAERFFARRGRIAVLAGRVLPVVRTFISLPAGIARMPRAPFLLLTLVGCLPWTIALALIGQGLAKNWDTITKYFTPIGAVIAVIIVALAVRWYILRRRQEATAP